MDFEYSNVYFIFKVSKYVINRIHKFFLNRALHKAILDRKKNVNARYELCEYWLDKGAEINARHAYNRTPLELVINPMLNVRDDGRLFDLFISRGANVNTKMNNRNRGFVETPLLVAVASNRMRIAKKLLDLGAEVNTELCNCYTILAESVISGNEDMVKLLLGYNAKINDGYAIYTAAIRNHRRILDIMFENGADFSKIYFGDNINTVYYIHEMILKNRNCSIVKYLLENRVDLCLETLNERLLFYVRQLDVWEDVAATRKRLHFIMKHFAVVAQMDPTFSEKLRVIFNAELHLVDIFENYCKEIESMKISVKQNTNVTYFDLLTKTGKSLMRYCDGETVSIVSKPAMEQLFPNFVGRLRRNVQRGNRQRRTDKHFKQMLFTILKSRLPFELICYISDFLEISDLTALKIRSDPTMKCKFEIIGSFMKENFSSRNFVHFLRNRTLLQQN